MRSTSHEGGMMSDTGTRHSRANGFTHEHRVRYHEADAQGFLFNGRYLELADVAMTEYFRSRGFPYRDLVTAGTDPSVVDVRIQFAIPAHFDDLLSITVACVRVGTSSFQLDMGVCRANVRLADLQVTYVNVDPSTAKSRPLPEEVAAALRSDIRQASLGSVGN